MGGKRKGRSGGGSGHRNKDGSVSQSATRGDPRTEKLNHLMAEVSWDGDAREAWELKAVDLAEDQPGFLVTVDNFLTPYECKQLRSIMEQVGLNPASKADLKPRKNEAYLNRESLACPCRVLYDKIYERMRPFAPELEGRECVGLTERLRYYIYRKGHRFDAHVDVSNKGPGPGEETEYTLLIYLNGTSMSDLEGGETIFWETKKKELCRIAPEQGKLLLHAHGHRCLLHAGNLVTRGVKYMIRSDVMYRREGAQSSNEDAYRPKTKDYTV
ncbi:Fe2OG dioxygenase domain-containing protein [Chloropicon primus]|uniref:Fe2OG dioxygenase domain-containing protein n=1 Tax=Chloropicon primus TaxID=1764295 RepID=A0A5B8MSE6_9CHLO|nr:hypothetical protein A3770_11p61760 [Chloropicon primus]UPR02871.1 Fe2OG dioxygenase domain-containing protein [Chloropicon primus]|eukprot:QDZ23658.1 hypothetical protein A3770_11p61760 [Chloropicon primus]